MLVVGLLTIISMLGSTILIVSYLSAKQHQEKATRITGATVVGGYLQILKNILVDDMYIGVSIVPGNDLGPFGDWGTGGRYPRDNTCWTKYAVIPTAAVDYWLTDNGQAGHRKDVDRMMGFTLGESSGLYSYYDIAKNPANLTEFFPYMSQVLGIGKYRGEKDGEGRLKGVDTNGDAIDPNLPDKYEADALEYVGTSFDERGQLPHVGIRVIDLSGMLPVNTAGYPQGEGEASVILPTQIDIEQFLSDGEDKRLVDGEVVIDSDTSGEALDEVFVDLHRARCGGSTPPLDDFWRDSGCRLYQSTGSYSPFAVSEEQFLRWRRAVSSSARGPLWNVLERIDGASQLRLTTLSISSIIPRHPIRGDADISGLTREVLYDSETLDDWQVRDSLYPRLKAIIGDPFRDPNASSGGSSGQEIVWEENAASYTWYYPTNHGCASWPIESFYHTQTSTELGSGVGGSPDGNGSYNYSNRQGIMGTYPGPGVPGRFKVEMWWPEAPYNIPFGSVSVFVNSANGQDPRGVDQSSSSGQWYLIDTYDFTGDATEGVSIVMNGCYSNQWQQGHPQAAFDAVRYVEVAAEVREPHEAAHFIANLWAHTSQGDAIDRAYVYSPNTEPWWVAGVVEQLVISDVFAFYMGDPDDSSDNLRQWAYAIELFNPNDEPVNLTNGPAGAATNFYRLKCGDRTWDFTEGEGTLPVGSSGRLTVQPGDRIVLYSIYNGPDYDLPANEQNKLTEGMMAFDASAGAAFVNIDPTGSGIMEEFHDKGLQIVRHFGSLDSSDGMAGTLDIPVDSVHPTEIGLGAGAVAGVLRDDHFVTIDTSITVTSLEDIDMGRHRALVAAWKDDEDKACDAAAGTTSHHLGVDNGLLDTDLVADAGTTAMNVFEGFWIRRRGSLPRSISDLGDVYLVGPDSDGLDLPHKLCRRVRDLTDVNGGYVQEGGTAKIDIANSYHDKTSRGRAHLGKINPRPMMYPDVPWSTMIPEVIELVAPDPTNDIQTRVGTGSAFLHTRIFGRININTAPLEVMERLNWPKDNKIVIYKKGDVEIVWDPVPIDRERIARFIMDYRMPAEASFPLETDPGNPNMVSPQVFRTMWEDLDNQINPDPATLPNMDPVGLRTAIGEDYTYTAVDGFVTPGEIALPLAHYVEQELITLVDDNMRRKAWFLDARDCLYKDVANLVTVNSDVFAVTSRIGSKINNKFRVAIIDRSHCRGDVNSTEAKIVPPTVLFSLEVK